MRHDYIDRAMLVGANKEGSTVAEGCVYTGSSS